MPSDFRIGLTGGIASGKSTVAQRFSELGIAVIDADVASRAVVALGTDGLEGVVQRFGTEVLDAHGELNRSALRKLIFSDANARADLNAIVHPLIHAHMEREADRALGPYLVMAIPLLTESGRRDRLDRILVIDVDESTQLQRLTQRDRTSAEEARAILAAQATRAARLNIATDVLTNNGTVEDLRQAVDRLHDRYLQLARQKQGLP